MDLDPNRIEALDISYYFLQLFSIISSLFKRGAERCSISLDPPLGRSNFLYVVEKKEKWKFKVWLKINESHGCQSGTASSAAYLLRALQFLELCNMLVGWEKQQKKTPFKPIKNLKIFYRFSSLNVRHCFETQMNKQNQPLPIINPSPPN